MPPPDPDPDRGRRPGWRRMDAASRRQAIALVLVTIGSAIAIVVGSILSVRDGPPAGTPSPTVDASTPPAASLAIEADERFSDAAVRDRGDA